MAEGGSLSVRDLLSAGSGAPDPEQGTPLRALRRRATRDVAVEHVSGQLRAHGGNVTRAAEALGMRRTSLQRLLKAVGLDPRAFRKEAPPK
jgi:DNA-binding NtrC family response regulator